MSFIEMLPQACVENLQIGDALIFWRASLRLDEATGKFMCGARKFMCGARKFKCGVKEILFVVNLINDAQRCGAKSR